MSETGFAHNAATLLRGRWQIPVALIAAVTGGATLYRLMPRPGAVDLDALLADVAALEEAGATVDAADALANLLEMEPLPPSEQRAQLHERLADLIYRQQLRRSTPNLHDAALLLKHQDAADALGCPPSPARSLRAAQVADWLGNAARAVPAYRATLAQDPTPEQRRAAQQGLVRHLENRPEARQERQQLLEALMADEDVSVKYLWWALQQSLQDALDENDTVRARLLLGRHGRRLKTSDLKGYAEYLWAWVMVQEGRPEEAEPLTHWIDEWLDTQPPGLPELRDFGHLPAMNRWLLGRIHLAQHRPQDALEAFEEAAALQPLGELLVAAIAGQARALAELERHDAAQHILHTALEKLAATPSQQKPGIQQLRRSLLELFDTFVDKQDFAHAADYLILATELTLDELTKERLDLLEKVGQTYQQAADKTTDAQLRRHYLGQIGHYLEQAAQLARSDEARCAAALWSAAQGYDQAGQLAHARRVLLRFLDGRSLDPRLPQAFLQLGRSFEADGEFGEALPWYQRLTAEYPTLGEAYQANLLSARCLWALGQDAEAEATLRGLLEDDYLTPSAPVFHDALLELCDLLYQQGRYGEAIGQLEDFSTRYPEDREHHHSRFLLADAYRRSAYALRENPPADADPAQAAAASRDRFRQAATLFRTLSHDLAAQPPADQGAALYQRLSLFYQADCLFELNTPESLQEALETYRRAAARYEREPAALTAQVQIANIYLRLGLVTEAAQAVEQARWLLPSIPGSAFDADPHGADRHHWERYLIALVSSDLFRGVFAGDR